jgi:O-antigen/teichoic acid export membrane protein
VKTEADEASEGAEARGVARTLEGLQPRTLRRNAVAAVARWIVSLAVMAAVFPVMLDRLGASTFGLWAVLTTPTSLMGVVGLGVAPATVVLLGRAVGAAVSAPGADVAEPHLREAGRICGATMVLSIAAAGLALALGWLVTTPVLGLLDLPTSADDERYLFRSAVVCLAAMLIGSGILAQLEAACRVDLTSFSWAAVSVTNAVLLLVATLVSPGLRALAYVQLITAALNVAIPAGLFVYSRVVRLWSWLRVDIRALRSIAALGFTLGTAGALVAAVDPLVKLVLGSSVGMVPVAAYELAQRVVRLAGGLFTSALQPLFAHVSSSAGAGRLDGVPETVARALRSVAPVGLPALTALALGASAFIGLWLGDEAPQDTALSITVLCPGMALNLLTTPSYHAVQGAGHGVRALSVQVGTLICVGTVLAAVTAGLLPESYGGSLATAAGWTCGAAITVVHFGAVYGWSNVVRLFQSTSRAFVLSALVAPWPIAAESLGLGDAAVITVTATAVVVVTGLATAGWRPWPRIPE